MKWLVYRRKSWNLVNLRYFWCTSNIIQRIRGMFWKHSLYSWNVIRTNYETSHISKHNLHHSIQPCQPFPKLMNYTCIKEKWLCSMLGLYKNCHSSPSSVFDSYRPIRGHIKKESRKSKDRIIRLRALYSMIFLQPPRKKISYLGFLMS